MAIKILFTSESDDTICEIWNVPENHEEELQKLIEMDDPNTTWEFVEGVGKKLSSCDTRINLP